MANDEIKVLKKVVAVPATVGIWVGAIGAVIGVGIIQGRHASGGQHHAITRGAEEATKKLWEWVKK